MDGARFSIAKCRRPMDQKTNRLFGLGRGQRQSYSTYGTSTTQHIPNSGTVAIRAHSLEPIWAYTAIVDIRITNFLILHISSDTGSSPPPQLYISHELRMLQTS